MDTIDFGGVSKHQPTSLSAPALVRVARNLIFVLLVLNSGHIDAKSTNFD